MRGAGRSLALHAALLAGAFLTLTPLVWMVSVSVMAAGDHKARW